MTYLVFRRESVPLPNVAPPADAAAVIWRPSIREFRPRGASGKSFLVWWLFHFLGVFSNRDYGQLLIYDRGGLAHRSLIFPRYFRFPFMSGQDLQIGDTWTREDRRGQGLATFAITEIVSRRAKSGRAFWYVTESANIASIRAVESAGFRLAAQAARTHPLGLRALGAYVLESFPE